MGELILLCAKKITNLIFYANLPVNKFEIYYFLDILMLVDNMPCQFFKKKKLSVGYGMLDVLHVLKEFKCF